MQKTILESWTKYIDLESLEQAKFAKKKDNTKQLCNIVVTDDNIDSVTISFSDQPELFSVLKEQFPIPRNTQEWDPKPLFLFFPLIEQVEKNKVFFHPLFAIEITHQKQTFYSDGKLTIRPYKEAGYTPLVAAFNRFLGIPAEEFHENIPLNLLLNRITAGTNQTFKKSLASLKRYIADNLISGKSCNFEAMFNGRPPTEHSKKLQNELIRLQRADFSHAPLATQYLEHMANPHKEDNLSEDDLWQGAFNPQYPLTKGQAAVLRKLERGDELIAVQGGPGTGKTALFLSIIASRLVRRAVQLASTGEDMNTLTIIVSTTNRVVDDVVERFLKDEEFKDQNHFYFIGGKQDKISNSLSRVKKLIEDLKIAHLNQETYEATKQELLAAAAELRRPLLQYRQIRSDYQQLLTEGQRLFGGVTPENWEGWVQKKAEALFDKAAPLGYGEKPPVMEALKNWLQKQQTEVQQYNERLWTLQQQYPKADIAAFDPEAHAVKEMLDVLKTVKERFDHIPFWQIEFLFKKRSKIFSQWKKRFKNVLKTVANNYQSLVHRDVAELLTFVSSLQRDSFLLKQLKPNMELMTADLKGIANEAETLSGKAEKVRDMLRRVADLQERLAPFESPDFTEYYRLQTVAQQRKIYELSFKFLNLEMVRRKKEMINVLQDWQDILNRNNDFKVAKKWEKQGVGAQFTLLSLAYPVLTSTLTSSYNFFRAFFSWFKNKNGQEVVVDRVKKEKPAHLVLCDESGMCALHTIFPLLYKSEKAIIVGDPKQLVPIIPVGKVQAREYEEENFSTIDQAYAYSPISVSVYHRAAGCKTGHFDDIGEGIVLDEHRRCQPDIADLFIELANYSGLSVKTADLSQDEREKLDKFGGRNLVFYNVDGTKGRWRNTNTDEVKAIDRILTKIEKAGYDLAKEVGIITPFTGQENLLVEAFRQRLGHRHGKAKIGTLHKFQGAEFNVIIFSAVIFAPGDSTWFLNSKPNLLNVAVSRAKHLFITCGNFQKLLGAGDYLQILCNHSQDYGYLIDGTPDDRMIKLAGTEYLDTCNHALYLSETLEGADKEVVIISPWLRYDEYLAEQLLDIEKAVERGVEVRIFYGWKMEDPRETEDQIRHYRKVLGQNLIRVSNHTHEKCVIRDRKEMAIGSFNWLSHSYTPICKKQQACLHQIAIRRESSVVVRDKKVIEQLLNGLF
jgi:hypothetical protein